MKDPRNRWWLKRDVLQLISAILPERTLNHYRKYLSLFDILMKSWLISLCSSSITSTSILTVEYISEGPRLSIPQLRDLSIFHPNHTQCRLNGLNPLNQSSIEIFENRCRAINLYAKFMKLEIQCQNVVNCIFEFFSDYIPALQFMVVVVAISAHIAL